MDNGPHGPRLKNDKLWPGKNFGFIWLSSDTCNQGYGSPRLTALTQVIVWEVFGVDLHTLDMLPHTTHITRDHVAIVMLQLTDTPSNIVTIILLYCVGGGQRSY